MTTLRQTPTNGGDDTDSRIWGIEGPQRIGLVIAGLVASLLLFLVGSTRLGLANGPAIALGCLPAAAAIALARFQQTHPPGYLTDLLALWLSGPSFGPPPPASTKQP